MNTQSKSMLEYQQRRPLRTGTHGIEEYAFLRVVREKSDHEIAVVWGMRPRAGRGDLQRDVKLAWERAGYPFGSMPPPIDFSKPLPLEDQEAWRAWGRARPSAISQWLRSLVAQGEPLNHCGTCTCHRPFPIEDAP